MYQDIREININNKKLNNKMRRKIVKQGAATMMISLPAKWVKKNQLVKGDEVDIDETGNSIVVRNSAKETKRGTEISLGSLTESSVRTILTNTYRLGYDHIKINFKDKKILNIIDNVIKTQLIGFEIIKKADTYCEIENITEPSKDQFDNIFSKVFLNIDELFEIAEKMLIGGKADFLDTEQKIKQFDNFCRRVITKGDFEDSVLRWVFHNELIHAQRDIFHMLVYISKNKVKATKDTLDLLHDCKNVYELLKKAYKEKSMEDLEKIHDLQKEIVFERGHVLMRKGKSRVIKHYLISAVRNFYLASSPLSGMFTKQS